MHPGLLKFSLPMSIGGAPLEDGRWPLPREVVGDILQNPNFLAQVRNVNVRRGNGV